MLGEQRIGRNRFVQDFVGNGVQLLVGVRSAVLMLRVFGEDIAEIREIRVVDASDDEILHTPL